MSAHIDTGSVDHGSSHVIGLMKLIGLWVVLVCCTNTLVLAEVEPEICEYRADSIMIDSTIVVFDNKSYYENGSPNLGYSSQTYVEYLVRNTAYLEINQTLDSCFLDTFSFWVDLELTYLDVDSNVFMDTIRLEVRHDTALSQANNTRASFVFYNGLWSSARVMGMSDTTLKKYMIVGQTLNITRYRVVNSTMVPEFVDTSLNSETGELIWNWGEVDSAEFYQLEWTWVDAYDSTSSSGLKEVSQLEDVSFRHNSTRIQTDSTSYAITLAYERGFLVARVRGCSYNSLKPNQIVCGKWSDSDQSGSLEEYLVDNAGIKLDSIAAAYRPLDEHMNWQYSATYAEWGKKKEVISYYDGSLRNRQSVTRVSTTMHSVVGETIYDFEGRPAVNILPVPTFDKKLNFYPRFNLSANTGQTFSKHDFDSIPSQICGIEVSPLKSSSGAAHYYSASNDSASSRKFGFIPDSKGYPFTVTQYTADGTGRIKSQGGVGADHQIRTGHETRYFYATPQQTELDRLFGNAVGKKVHYQKEMIIDPNGQVSVSYKDLAGKVIATALGGDGPDNLATLTGEANALVALSDTIESNFLTSQSEISSNKVLLVPDDNVKYDVFYGLSIPRLVLDSLPSLCFDCVYELEISLKDDCNNELLDGDPVTNGNQAIVRTVGVPGSDFDVNCESNGLFWSLGSDAAFDSSRFEVYLNKGQYILSKTLRISRNAYEYYWEKVKQSEELPSLDDFFQEALNELDTASCTYDCQECFDSMGSYVEYKAVREALLMAQGFSNVQIDTLTYYEYQTKVAQCSSLCREPFDRCEVIYHSLLVDLMPGGQYADRESKGNTGIFNLNDNGLDFNYKQYKDSLGVWQNWQYLDDNDQEILLETGPQTISQVNLLSEEQYIYYYNSRWAETIVSMHPEYCRYEFCVENQSSFHFTDSMQQVDNFDSAIQKGYLDPLTNDPYFKDPLHHSDKAVFQSEYYDTLSRFAWSVAECGPYSIPQIAALVHFGDTSDFANCTSVTNWLSNFNVHADSCASRRDAYWRTFRGLYLSQKDKFFQEQLYCEPVIPNGFEPRIPDLDAFDDETSIDEDEDDPEQIRSNMSDTLSSQCESYCEGQALYWLAKLGSCNLDSATQDTLVEAFVRICKNGCDTDHPFGARSYVGTGQYSVHGNAKSFQEAFDSIVHDSLKVPGQCDVWTIAVPFSRDHTVHRLANVNDTCLDASLGSDTCYNNTTEHMQDYLVASQFYSPSTTCEDCIDCDDFHEAWTDLAARYGGIFVDSTWQLKQVLTNYMNAYFGFNLNYLDYHDFAHECYQFGVHKDSDGVPIDYSWLGFPANGTQRDLNPLESEEQYESWGVSELLYASISGGFFPIVNRVMESASSSVKYIDTCACNILQNHLDTFANTYPSEHEAILNGTYDSDDLADFHNYVDSKLTCEPDNDSSFSIALLICRDVYKLHESMDLGLDSGWSESTLGFLENEVMFRDLTIDDACFPCAGDHPSENNDFWDNPPSGSSPPWYPSGGSCLDCPDCEDLSSTIDSMLYSTFGLDTVASNTQWHQFVDCFKSSLCEVRSPNNLGLCENCSPQDSILGSTIIRIEDLYDSIWQAFDSAHNTIWQRVPTLAGFGVNRDGQLVAAEDSFTSIERMKLLLSEYGKCIASNCNYCYPCHNEYVDSSCVVVAPTCCKDTTIYYDLMNAFLSDLTGSNGTLGNHYVANNWDIYPDLFTYYGTRLYSNYCYSSLNYRILKYKMPVLNFVVEDSCGDEFYVVLSYVDNYSNQAHYGKIVSIDSLMIFPEPEYDACAGTNRFIIKATQEGSGQSLIQVEIYGYISDYDVYAARISRGDSCELPKLCNRPFGYIVTDTVVNPCVAEKIIQARNIATVRYNHYMDSLQSDFKIRYYNRCMGPVDTLAIDYDLKEYHYTLYYYDLAGNLIQTVPPEGVRIISDADSLAQIKQYRDGLAVDSIFANHSLVTRYRYNSLNEVRHQVTPDSDTSLFWYDYLGRMAVSQNASQRIEDYYSYTEYDDLGRIIEVGQIYAAMNMTRAIAFDTAQLCWWLTQNTKDQITRTWYDTAAFVLSNAGFTQSNLRGRVSSMAYFNTDSSDHAHAVHYTYDIHGNVDVLLREISALHDFDQGYKRVDYDYDLVSGNVNHVYYQKDEFDQFTHYYQYDADNRISNVKTSSDQVHWDNDALYHYYWHGPLRRMEIGQLKVQGVDYAYTLHGWLKGVNSNSLDKQRDQGQDGFSVSINQNVARDVFGFSLHYYHEDYSPINESHLNASTYFLMNDSSSTFKSSVGQLFNGNISRMVTAIYGLDQEVIGKAYEYDQLNRISQAHTYDNYLVSTNRWLATSGTNDHYSSYSYDANGNILTLNRYAGDGQAMDSLTYNYISGTNQLEYVNDSVSASRFDYDIDDQSSGNYAYDAIGNLIHDLSEEIDTITWTVYGKIKSIIRTSSSSKPDLSFEYSPDGHRVAKHVTDSNDNTTTTWYIRDASGNIMATYSRTWEMELDTSELSVQDVYDQLSTNTSYSARVTFLDQELQWHEHISSSKLDELEILLSSDLKEEDFLDYFSALTFMNQEVFDSLYAHFHTDSIYVFLKDAGYSDGDLAEALCNSCPDSFLVAGMGHDYSGFLTNLASVNSAQFDDICTNTGAPPSPPADVNTQVNHIVNSSTILNTVGIMSTYGHNCTDYENVLSNIVTYNTPGSRAVLTSMDDFKACIKSDLSMEDISQAMEDYYGAGVLWDSIFSIFPSTQSDYVDSIRINDVRDFLKNSMLALNSETQLSHTVEAMSSTYLSEWFDAIKNFYGQDYYGNLIQALLPGNSTSHWTYSLNEHHIYGSSRLGIKKYNKPLYEQMVLGEGSQGNFISESGDTLLRYTYNDSVVYQTRGATYYELSNHLGNVLVVVTDRKLQACNDEELMYYTAQIVSTADYYPFGMMIEERSKSHEFYRFGFNGQEKDDENSGTVGGHLVFRYRIHDARLGRFLSLDPLFATYPYYSPYQFAGNIVISCTDIEGKEPHQSYKWKAIGLTEQKVNKIVDGVSKGIEKSARVGGDAMMISGGVVAIVGTGGTASTLIGLASFAGGTKKLMLDLRGEFARADNTPSTISGFTAVTINYMVGDELFSHEAIVAAEYVESVLTLDIKGALDDLPNTRGLFDILNVAVETPSNLQNLKELFLSSDELKSIDKISPSSDYANQRDNNTVVTQPTYNGNLSLSKPNSQRSTNSSSTESNGTGVNSNDLKSSTPQNGQRIEINTKTSYEYHWSNGTN